MRGRITAWAWLTACAIESNHSDHCGRTSCMRGRGVEPDSAATCGGDLNGLIVADHRAPDPAPLASGHESRTPSARSVHHHPRSGPVIAPPRPLVLPRSGPPETCPDGPQALRAYAGSG